MTQLTISAIKADVGSIGGHTRPSKEMLTAATGMLSAAQFGDKILSFDVTHTGDDICLLMVHGKGDNNAEIHQLAWDTFMDAAKIAKKEGLDIIGQPDAKILKEGPDLEFSIRAAD